jgi:aminoglycoside 2''-phosphotransferase
LIGLAECRNMKKQHIKKKALLRKIKNEFPKLSFSQSKLIDYGDDHLVIILDGKIVFRFPRTALYRKSFAGELKLLDALKGKTPLPLPDYIYLSKKKNFGGYPLIKGKELTETRFTRLTSTKKKKIISDIAQFLEVLHSTNKNVLPANRAAEPWSMDDLVQYKTRYWKQRRKIIAAFVDKQMLKIIDSFYDYFIEACSNCSYRSIIHGDLSGDHMLLDTKQKRLSGIIDLADAAIGDPAHDFSFFWNYGDEVAKAVYQIYGLRKDKKLLERSEWYYIRYAIDRLYFLIKAKKKRKAAWIRNILRQRIPILLDHSDRQ